MEDSRATLHDVPKVATTPHPPPAATAAAASERPELPVSLAAESTAAGAKAPDEAQTPMPHGLEGAAVVLAARGVEGARGEEKGAGGEAESPMGSHPPPVDHQLGFLPGGGGQAAWRCPEKPKDSSGPPDAAAEAWRVPPRPREHKSLAPRRVESPLSQLSNPRHDAHLAHAIR